uniref:Uncharacterized protein n=1 Tax=Arundo donax TaxID=35708 RepID=A0A0A9FLZ2_ARUDO
MTYMSLHQAIDRKLKVQVGVLTQEPRKELLIFTSEFEDKCLVLTRAKAQVETV